MNLISLVAALSTLLCTLLAGFVFAFDIVIMPGIQRMNDRDFLRAFQAMDRVIQNNQPMFMLVWLGSATTLLVLTVLGIRQLPGADRLLLIAACAAFYLGVQLPTVTVNVPLNNQLQALELNGMNEAELLQTRTTFEPRWIRWNRIRTVFAILTSVLLILMQFRL